MAADDDALMIRYKAGDAGAFEALYARHKGALYRYFLRQAPREAADDLFQEAWLRVVNGARSYAPNGSFPAYLYRVAHNVLVDFYRRRKPTQVGNHKEAAELADPGCGPAAALEQSMLRERLKAALRALPPPQREAFLLHQEAGLTLEQIADVVGSNRETVKSRLRYATSKLKRVLGDLMVPLERSA